MRIMMVCDHFPDYGTKSVMTLSRALVDKGHDVLVASTSVGIDGRRMPLHPDEDYIVTRFPSIPVKGFPYSFTPFAERHLIETAKVFRPDVIHTHFIMYWLGLASSSLVTKGYPLVLSLHGFTLPYELGNKLISTALRVLYLTKGRELADSASAIVCVSKAVRERFGTIYPSLLPHTSIVHFGISPEELLSGVSGTREETRERLGLKGKFTFVFVGRVVREKGVFELIRAFRELRRRRSDVALLLVGDGEALPQLERYEASTEDLHFLGFRKDVGTYLCASDLFVLPSYREGLPTALIEALFFGLQFIATPVGGVSDLVALGCKGRVLQELDSTNLLVAMDEAASSGDYAIESGATNRRIVQEYLTWDRAIGKHLEIYRNLLHE